MPRAFKLLKTLGEGAFGAVHLAEVREDEDFVQTLAVKWLHDQWSADQELVGRLRDEARLLALLSHEHIVRVHGLTTLEGRLAILMEAIDGVDLSRLDEVPIPPRASMEIVAATADALDAAWCTVPSGKSDPLRVVHRDIKPSNIMVTARGGVKVMDFGVARARFDTREADTRSQQFGTARYMAPERWLEGLAEAPSDVFSLGITALELLGGQPIERPRLARGAFGTDMAIALDVVGPWPEIRELVARMCAFDPQDRPTAAEVSTTARELAQTLSKPDLRQWSEAWVPDNIENARQSTADGTVVNEERSADAFGALTATATAGGVDTPATGTVRLGPTGRGVVIGLLLAMSAAGVTLTWTAPSPQAAVQPTAEPTLADSPSVPDIASPEVEAPVEPSAPTEPAPDLTSVPAAETAPQPTRRKVVAVPTPPAVAEEQPTAPTNAPLIPITFIVPEGLSMAVEGQVVDGGRKAIALPMGGRTVNVDDGADGWTCAISVGTASATYRLNAESKHCKQVL